MSRHIDVVIQGVLGTTPVIASTSHERSYCHFRVATTPSFRSDDGWRDGPTLWFTAKAWGNLADNLAMSLRKGDPVILVGRFSQETWVRDNGQDMTTNVVTVSAAGHDLTRGRSSFMKVAPSPSPHSRMNDKAAQEKEAAEITPSEQAYEDNPWDVPLEEDGIQEGSNPAEEQVSVDAADTTVAVDYIVV